MKTNSYTWLTRCCHTVKVTSRLYFFGAMWCIRQRIDSHSRCWQKIYILKCAKLSFPTEHPKPDHTLLTSFLPLCQCYRKLNQIFCYGGKNCLVCFSLNRSQSSQGPFRQNHSSPPIHLKEGSVLRLWLSGPQGCWNKMQLAAVKKSVRWSFKCTQISLASGTVENTVAKSRPGGRVAWVSCGCASSMAKC